MPRLEGSEYWKAASSAFATEALELTILPTEQCNLRCTYCYEAFELGHMEAGVVTAIKQLITNRITELHKLSVDWFGGEPLLAMDVIEEISGLAQQLADLHPELEYKSSITTNGVLLTSEYAQRLSAVGVRHLHVSLDGPDGVHDQTRRLRGGRGTFRRIEQNLLAIRDSDTDTRVDLRVHVTPANSQRSMRSPKSSSRHSSSTRGSPRTSSRSSISVVRTRVRSRFSALPKRP